MMGRTVYVETSIIRPKIEKICAEQGHAAPILCTPEELVGELADD